METPAIAHIPEQHFGPELLAGFIPEGSTGPQMTVLPILWSGTSIHVIPVVSEHELGTKTLAEAVRIREDVSTTRDDYAPEGDSYQTSITTGSAPIVLLEESARAGDYRTFAALARAIDWSAHPPEDLLRTISLAFSLELATLTMDLAQLGGRLFPDDERVQRKARVLAPPEVRAVRPPRARGLGASMAWFDDHASEYRGQWVAVREGQLLGAADSLEELMPLVGEGEDAISTIVTRVL